MNYDKEIYKVLIEAGSAGLSVKKITHHVFNSFNGLFFTADYDEIHTYVVKFLRRHSIRKNPEIVRVRWGVYRLNLSNRRAQQLLLQFEKCNDSDDKPDKPQTEDHSLSLF